jgi:hypothetical protein
MSAGLCECGCGTPTRISQVTDPRKGAIRGQPRRFARGHSGHKWSSPGHTVDPSTGCWNWNGYRRGRERRAGAKRLRDGTYKSSYVYYYERAHGPVPAGLVLDHTCKNPGCVNPDHLEPVTTAVNTRRGAGTKLTESDVLTIRASRGSVSPAELARQFGVARSTIYDVLNGAKWKGVAA